MGVQVGDRRVTPALHDLWAYADLIPPPAPEPRWQWDQERRAAGEAERGWVDAVLKSREKPCSGRSACAAESAPSRVTDTREVHTRARSEHGFVWRVRGRS